MRPKRIILYVSASETDLGLMRFMLTTNGYAVRTTQDVDQAVAIMTQVNIALVMIDADLGRDAVARVKQIDLHPPVILRGDPLEIERAGYVADAVVSTLIGTAELLERIKVMSARKRGPKKGSPGAMRCGPRSVGVVEEVSVA
jgi:DNA-binding response OmpR family regulator